MSSNTFEIIKTPARIESITFAKAKPKSANDAGAGVKKLKLWLSVNEKEMMRNIAPLFAGVIDENTAHRVASEGGAGFEVRSKKKLGVSNVVVLDPQGDILFESKMARVERPKLIIGKEGKVCWLVLDVEMGIPKKALAVVDDYFKADVLVSVANAQLDLEDEVKAKVEKSAAKNAKRSKGGAVEWSPREAEAE